MGLAPPPGVEVIETTADVGLALRGGSLAELFAAAISGFTYLTVGEAPGPGAEAREVELSAEALPDLLVAWLQWALLQFDADGWVPAAARVDVAGTSLRATVTGSNFVSLERPVWHYIKGVSYHGLHLGQNEDGQFAARVIFDV